MPSAGFEPAIQVSKLPQTHALYRVATVKSCYFIIAMLLSEFYNYTQRSFIILLNGVL
jgi:hypothetical protein